MAVFESDSPNASDQRYMRTAIELAQQALHRGGGPFGAIVVSHGNIIGRGYNQVTQSNDPTAHAEVVAIRDACAKRGEFHLQGCILYSSCQPCPMCLSAAYWAQVDGIYYAATAEDAAAAGFQDAFLYRELALPAGQRSLPIRQLPDSQAAQVFIDWQQLENKTPY